MAHAFPDNNDDFDHRDRWPSEAPTAAIARVVLRVDDAITLKRRAAAAWLAALGNAQPALPVRPTRIELAVIIALAETYGAPLYQELRFVPVLDFIAGRGAVKLVQRVMYGETGATDGVPTWAQSENRRFAGLLREARVAFEFLCGTWPEVFLAQAHATLAKIGVQVRPSDPGQSPSNDDEGEGGDDGDGEGGHA